MYTAEHERRIGALAARPAARPAATWAWCSHEAPSRAGASRRAANGLTAHQGHKPGLLPGNRRRDLALCRSRAFADRPHPARRGCHHDAHRRLLAARASAAGHAGSRTSCAAGSTPPASTIQAYMTSRAPRPQRSRRCAWRAARTYPPSAEAPGISAVIPAAWPSRSSSGDRHRYSASDRRTAAVVHAHRGVPQVVWAQC